MLKYKISSCFLAPLFTISLILSAFFLSSCDGGIHQDTFETPSIKASEPQKEEIVTVENDPQKDEAAFKMQKQQEEAEAARIAAEQQRQQEEEAARVAAEQQRQQQEAQLREQQEQERRAAEEAARAQAATGEMVYIASSGNGKKYHSNPNCSKMKAATAISISSAKSQGYTPCSKCY